MGLELDSFTDHLADIAKRISEISPSSWTTITKDNQAQAIANILSTYQKLQSDRKPELLNRKITLDPMKDPAKDASAVLYSDQLYFANGPDGRKCSTATPPCGCS